MAKYSDWRSDLREVIDDDTDNKKVTGKGCDNKKLIKINPKLGEAVEQIGGQILEVAEVDTVDGEEEDKAKKFEKEKQDKIEDKNKKKEMMLKKRIVRMKMMAVNQGAGDSLVAHHEPEGEMVESAVLDANKKIKKQEQRKKDEKEYARLMAILAHQKDLKKRGLGEEAEELDEAERKLSDRLHRKRKLYDRTVKKAMDFARREGEAAGHARYRMGQLDREMDKVKDKMNKEEVELDERLGGKGYSRSAMKSSIHPPSRQSTGDWEDSDRGKGNKARRRAGEKVEKKSPTYRAYVLNKEEVEVNEGVMKFIKDRVGGKKKPEKKAQMDKTTEKLHDLRRDKFKTDKQKEHEKYVNFLPVDEAVKGQDTEMRKVKADERKAGTDPKNTEDPTGKNYAKGQRASVSWWKDKTKVQKEEVVTELNRYGKETGKATGSLNKRPGSPVATRNQPNSAVNIVRRNIIRPQTGRPEGQQKKVKGEKGRVQPGDRKFTPAQTISRMRAQVAAADAAMRDTRGT
jgi:hypothetical protein